MLPPHALPSAAYLHECFLYDPDRGTLRWRRTRPPEHFSSLTRQRIWTTLQAGRDACHVMRGLDYKRTRIDGVYYLSHRIIFKMMELDDPKHEIDHVNGERGDNRWTNLRAATRKQNSWNGPSGWRLTPKKDRLPVGVSRIGNKFRACCGSKYIGMFETPEQAFAAYVAYARAERGEFYWPS